MTTHIGFIGAGSMGGPIAANLLKHGHSLVAYDIDAAAIERLKVLGAEAAPSPRVVASDAAIVFLCLPTLDALREVTLGTEGLCQGTATSICVNFSTAGPVELRAVIERARDTPSANASHVATKAANESMLLTSFITCAWPGSAPT